MPLGLFHFNNNFLTDVFIRLRNTVNMSLSHNMMDRNVTMHMTIRKWLLLWSLSSHQSMRHIYLVLWHRIWRSSGIMLSAYLQRHWNRALWMFNWFLCRFAISYQICLELAWTNLIRSSNLTVISGFFFVDLQLDSMLKNFNRWILWLHQQNVLSHHYWQVVTIYFLLLFWIGV